jgi:hypothetical protein
MSSLLKKGKLRGYHVVFKQNLRKKKRYCIVKCMSIFWGISPRCLKIMYFFSHWRGCILGDIIERNSLWKTFNKTSPKHWSLLFQKEKRQSLMIREVIEGNIKGEYYRGLLIYCFAFEFGHCFQPRSTLLKSKAAPSFSHT